MGNCGQAEETLNVIIVKKTLAQEREGGAVVVCTRECPWMPKFLKKIVKFSLATISDSLFYTIFQL